MWFVYRKNQDTIDIHFFWRKTWAACINRLHEGGIQEKNDTVRARGSPLAHWTNQLVGLINRPYIQCKCCLNMSLNHGTHILGGRRSQPMPFSCRFLCSSLLSNAPMCPWILLIFIKLFFVYQSLPLEGRIKIPKIWKSPCLWQWQWAASDCLEEYGHHCCTKDAAVDRLPWDSWGRTLQMWGT